MTSQPEQLAGHEREINGRLMTGLLMLKKRKFKQALEECEKALQIAPDATLAIELKRMAQERTELYMRGAVSIVTGFVLMWLMNNLTSSGRATLTNLGSFVLLLGGFLFLEGILVALIGVRAAYLIDGIAIMGVGFVNLVVMGMGGGIIFGALGAAELIWGGLGIRAYLRKTGMSYREIASSINALPQLEETFVQTTQPEIRKKLDAASRAYEKGKNRKDILEMIDAVIQQEPALAEAHNLRGMVLEDLHRMDEAAAAYREALRLEPSFYVAQENLTDLEARVQVLVR